MNNQGNKPFSGSGLRNEDVSMNSAHMGSDPASLETAEALRNTTYGHSGNLDTTHSGFGGQNIDSNRFGGDTTFGNHTSSGLQGTQTGSSANGGTNVYATRTGINSGQGVHAEQYPGPGTGFEGGGTTTFLSDAGGNRQGTGNFSSTARDQTFGHGSQHGTSNLTGSGSHPRGLTGASSTLSGSDHHPHGLSEGPGQTKMTTTTEEKTWESVSPYKLRPGETIVEHETRVHRGSVPGSGDHTSNLGGSKLGSSATDSADRAGLNAQRLGEQTGKPSVKDKITGGAEKMAGKMTSNADMVNRGEGRAVGDFDRVRN